MSSVISKDSESVVIETKISWKNIWDWETARITGARRFIDKDISYLMKSRLGFAQLEATKLISEIQKMVEKAPMWLWLTRDDPSWSERPTPD